MVITDSRYLLKFEHRGLIMVAFEDVEKLPDIGFHFCFEGSTFKVEGVLISGSLATAKVSEYGKTSFFFPQLDRSLFVFPERDYEICAASLKDFGAAINSVNALVKKCVKKGFRPQGDLKVIESNGNFCVSQVMVKGFPK